MLHKQGDLFFGAITLYLLALGMGSLILITVFGNSILPKSGIWFDKVKNEFWFCNAYVTYFSTFSYIARNLGKFIMGHIRSEFFSCG